LNGASLRGWNLEVPKPVQIWLILRMQITVISPLKDQLLQLTDPRLERRRKHELIDVLMIAVTALLCGAENFTHMAQFGQAKEAWLRTFLTLTHGIPSHDTFRRVFMLLAPEKFSAVFLHWTQSLRQAVGAEVVALDGKTLRRSFDSAKSQSAIHLVSAWASANRLVLGQIKVDDKSNEITAVPELLRALELAGCIVTVDALNCQKNIAKEIQEADADYVLALKGNHETAHEEIQTFLDAALEETLAAKPPAAKLSAGAATLATCETVDKGHGRVETRRYYQSAELDWFADRAAWEGLRTVGMVEALREVRGKLTVERRYYLSSLPLGVETFARAVREHWGVENQLHWVLDVQMNEDQNRARCGHAAENLGLLRRLVLNQLRRDTRCQTGIKGKQLNASWDHAYLQSLLGF
jgi:predicted transposase YbfD/YdcC